MEDLKVGDKIKALIDSPAAGGVKAGEIGIVVNEYSYKWIVDFPSQKGYGVTKSHLKHFELVNEKDDLLEEAKRRYPIGTKFIPAHIAESKNYICEVYDYNTIEIGYDYVDLYTLDARNGHSFTGRICHKGKWAEIIHEHSEIPKDWWIVAKDKDEARIIGEWFDKQVNDKSDMYARQCYITGYFSGKLPKADVWYERGYLEKNYPGKEITFKQFKKYVLKETEESFKTGDWAVITSLTSKKGYKLNGKIGHIFQIDRIGSDGYYHATKQTYIEGACWPLDCIRKALPHEIPVKERQNEEITPFWIKPIKNGPNNTTHPKYRESGFCGKEYKVIEHDKNSFPEHGGTYICEGGYCFYVDSCQKIDKPTPQFKTEFEVGKWYKSNYHTNSKNHWYYLKVTGFRNGTLNGERISKNSDTGEYMYEKESYWDSKETLTQAIKLGPLTDLSEIQAILPDHHPDKVKTKAEPMSYRGKFKVGDTVKCIGGSFMGASGASGGWRKDLIFTISDISNANSDYPIAWGGEHGNGVYFDQLELVKDKYVAGIDPFGSSTTFKFQIGDEMRVGPIGCDVDHYGYYNSESGDFQKIAGVSNDRGKIKNRITINNRNYYRLSCHNDDSYVSEDCLTLIKSAEYKFNGVSSSAKFEEYPLTPDECLIKPQIDAEVSKVKIKTKVPVTLKNTEKEVKINVKTNCSIKLN